MDNQQLKTRRASSRPWLVIADPSGDFTGRAFRTFDLNTRHSTYWPRGITFWNKKTGAVKKWNGSAFDVFTPKKTQNSQKAVA